MKGTYENINEETRGYSPDGVENMGPSMSMQGTAGHLMPLYNPASMVVMGAGGTTSDEN
jgi:hypothetical protein